MHIALNDKIALDNPIIWGVYIALDGKIALFREIPVREYFTKQQNSIV